MIPREIPENIIPFDKIANCKNLKDFYICFFCQDKQFNCVKNSPKKYLPLFKKSKGLIGLDYSVHTDMPIIVQKYQMYTNLSLMFYYGLHNIKIIPNIRWGLDETSNEFIDAIPRETLVAIGTHGFIKTHEQQQEWIAFISKIVFKLSPSGILVYGSHPDFVFNNFPNTKFYFIDSWTSSFWKERKNAN
jgi:hypothetical protein